MNFVLELQQPDVDHGTAEHGVRGPSTTSWWACYSSASWVVC